MFLLLLPQTSRGCCRRGREAAAAAEETGGQSKICNTWISWRIYNAGISGASNFHVVTISNHSVKDFFLPNRKSLFPSKSEVNSGAEIKYFFHQFCFRGEFDCLLLSNWSRQAGRGKETTPPLICRRVSPAGLIEPDRNIRYGGNWCVCV